MLFVAHKNLLLLLAIAVLIESLWGGQEALAQDLPSGLPKPNGDAVIRAPYGDSEIVITTTNRVAGAIHSLTWNGKEFIDSTDHGRQMQSAANFEVEGVFHPECYNPTEAGSLADGAGKTSSSRLLMFEAKDNHLKSNCQMAFWLPPNLSSGGHAAQNKTVLSRHLLFKKVRIGCRKWPNVVFYEIQYNAPRPQKHHFSQIEALTGYMPAEFNRFWRLNRTTLRLEPLDDGPGEQADPVVLSTENGSHAMGILVAYEPRANHPHTSLGYGRFRFEAEKVTKWNCVLRHRYDNLESAPSNYLANMLVVVGTQEVVEKTMGELLEYCKRNPDWETDFP